MQGVSATWNHRVQRVCRWPAVLGAKAYCPMADLCWAWVGPSVAGEIGTFGAMAERADTGKNINGEGRLSGCHRCRGVKVRGVNRTRHFGSLCCKWRTSDAGFALWALRWSQCAKYFVRGAWL